MNTFRWCAGIAAAVMLAGLTAAEAPAARSAGIEIKEFTYSPPQLTVPRGTTVTWTNHDEEPHTITSAQGEFGSTGLSHDEHFSQTFTRPGRYAYFCALHPHMKAVVTVE